MTERTYIKEQMQEQRDFDLRYVRYHLSQFVNGSAEMVDYEIEQARKHPEEDLKNVREAILDLQSDVAELLKVFHRLFKDEE